MGSLHIRNVHPLRFSPFLKFLFSDAALPEWQKRKQGPPSRVLLRYFPCLHLLTHIHKLPADIPFFSLRDRPKKNKNSIAAAAETLFCRPARTSPFAGPGAAFPAGFPAAGKAPSGRPGPDLRGIFPCGGCSRVPVAYLRAPETQKCCRFRAAAFLQEQRIKGFLRKLRGPWQPDRSHGSSDPRRL